jgi:hypothetical protein
MRMRTIAGVSVGSLFVMVAVAWAAGDWSAAKDKYDRFKNEYDNLRKLTPEETRRVVTATCEADENERRSVASDTSDRVASSIDRKYSDLKDLKEDALRKLDDVISDESLADKQSDAKSYKEEISRRWETIERMTRAIRGKNHPVVRYLVDEGNRAHRDYQTNSSYCHAYEFSMSSGRVDCLIAAGSTCYVVELKPDNSRAIGNGRGQVSGYAEELNNSADTRKKLVEKDSRFKDCTRFEARIDCYKLCPEIDSDGEMKSTYPVWRSRC